MLETLIIMKLKELMNLANVEFCQEPNEMIILNWLKDEFASDLRTQPEFITTHSNQDWMQSLIQRAKRKFGVA